MLVPINSMLIRGAEPVVVDTGAAEHRDQFFADLFSLVDPEDIRWVFISHDDVDHTGAVNELMELAPNATLVINWLMAERMGASLQVSPLRQRWMYDGEILDVADRKLLTVRPPVYDSPTTRGLFDTKTRVYWGSDCFGSPMPTPVRYASELPADLFEIGLATFSRYVSPWIEIAQPEAFRRSVDRIAEMMPAAIASCHGPVIARTDVERAIELIRTAPTAEILPIADQSVLDEIQMQLMAVTHG